MPICHSNVIGTHKAQETREWIVSHAEVVFPKRSRVDPVPEPKVLARRTRTDIDADSADDEADDGDDLDGRKEKLDFAVHRRREQIEDGDDDPSHDDPDGVANLRRRNPIVEKDCHGRKSAWG